MDIKDKIVIMLENDIKLNLKDEDNYFIERKFVRKYGKYAKGVYSHLSSFYLILNAFKDISDKEYEKLIADNKKKFKILDNFISAMPNAIGELKKKGPLSMAENYLFAINRTKLVL